VTLTREALARRIKSAIGASGLTQRSIADAIGLDGSALSRALKGERDFKTVEVALIAEKLGISVQSLLTDDGETPLVMLAAWAQRDATPAVDEAVRRVQVMLDTNSLLSDLGYVSCAENIFDIPLGTAVAQGKLLANKVRVELGIGDNDLPAGLGDFADLLEHLLGVDVAFEPLPWGLDGLSVSSKGFRLALVSSRVQATRQRYTLAHELGHIVAQDSQDLLLDQNVFGVRSDIEIRANAFAAEFLMPGAELRRSAGRGHLGEKEIADLLGRYRVSLDALAYHLHNTGIVNAAGRDRIRRMSSAVILLRTGRADELQARNEKRLPGNLLSRAVEAYSQAQISIRPIASLVEVEPDLLLEELSPRRATMGSANDSEDDDEGIPVL
jgi:Zn-dependent peptidase ImmA (M78 family)/transcriptional regulator with XRE-family HTH domain